MRAEFLEMLGQIKEKAKEVDKVPKIIWYKKMFSSLVNAGLEDNLAALIVGTMKVDINEAFINDTELVDTAITTYTELILKVKTELDKSHPDLFRWTIKSEPLSLTADF